MKKRKKIKKIKFKSFLILIIILLIIGLLIYYYTTLHITNIFVKGNNLLSEQEIIEEAELIDYPKIYEVNVNNIKNKLLKNDLINKVTVDKSLFGKITIEIEENKIIYKTNNNYMLSSGKIISLEKDINNVPILINEIDEDIINKFIKKFLLINDDIVTKISNIIYAKSELDNERFMFYMNDGNYVYVTLSKIELINSYNEIYPTLGDNKGILYLDSGNHFQIKNNKE